MPHDKWEYSLMNLISHTDSYFCSIDLLSDLCSIFTVKTDERTDTVRFTTKGQVVIPMWLRRQFEIEEGTEAIVMASSEGILLKPITAALVRRGRGMLKRKAGSTFQPSAHGPTAESPNMEVPRGR
jgi:AbrB family looped-hinge helix DNA binding protein